MKIYRSEDEREMGMIAADLVAAQLRVKPNSLLGLATGSTPVGMYEALAELCQAGKTDFSAAKTVNLDEYVSLSPENEQSYRYFMQKHLFERVNILPRNTFVPDGTADPAVACKRYDELLDSLGRIDLQVLGIGRNGHIGFNEPSDDFPCDTHVVELSESTIEANARFFASKAEVPRRAVTMGIRPILYARTVMLLVCGEEKAEIVKRAFTGPVTPRVPASILQLHPNFLLVGDRAALSLLDGSMVC